MKDAAAATRTRSCVVCGVAFMMKHASEGLFCSNDCYTAYRRALPHDERAALMANATSRIRGAKRSHADLCNRAIGKQRAARLSGDEAVIYDALVSSGLQPTPLLAVDKYNVDFGFPAAMLAVEYNGGNWHNTERTRIRDEAKRDVLESLGWHVLTFPRIDKPQSNDAGNVRIGLADIVAAVHNAMPPLAD